MSAPSILYLHPKQMEVYQNKSRFRVVVAGRRWGKCIQHGTLIAMSNGLSKKIEDIVAGDRITTVNEISHQIESKYVQGVFDNGVKETLIVRTKFGRELNVTPNHRILVNNIWTEAKDIVAGDLVAVPKRLGEFGTERLPDHEVDLLALWLAEGSDYTITNGSPDVVSAMQSAAAFIGMVGVAKDGINWRFFNGDRTGGSLAGTKNPFRKMLESYGLWGLNSKTKFIPDAIFRLPKDQLARFLNLFYACDGNISKRSKSTWSLEVGLANERMVLQLRDLLHRFGIRGSFRYKKHKSKSSVTGENFESWNYICSRPDAIKIFANEIGCLGKTRQLCDAVASGDLSRGNCNDYLPISHDEFVKHLKYEPVEKGRYGGYNACVSRDLPEELRLQLNSWRKQTPSRISRLRYEAIKKFSDGFFDSLANGDLAWEEVESVISGELAQTYDLSVEGNHNFIAEGIVTHNSQLSKISMIKYAKIRNRLIWYVAPSYRMAKDIMWPDLNASIPKRWIKKVNETTMTILLVNNTRIVLKGADSPDSLRGVGLHFLVMDEIQDIDPDAWKKVLRPTLASTGGHALFIGTPKSYNFLYELYILGQKAENQAAGKWHSWQFETITSPFIPADEIEAARADMDTKSFNQEFLASFEVMSGRVYHAFDRHIHVHPCAFNPHLPIWVGQDFNIDPMSSVILQPQEDGTLWAVDEIVLFGSNTEEVCDELERRYWRQLKKITLFPDPAGGYRQHARGESDLDIFKERGFVNQRYHKKHPPVADRVNAVNRMLKSADGKVRLYVDPKCKHLIESLEQTQYKKGGREINKDAEIEHSADAIGYPIQYQFPLRKIEIAGVSI